MIRIHLSRLLGDRKEKISDLQRGTGLARNTLSGLYREDVARIDLATLDAICKYYKCAVTDLLEYVPTDESVETSAE
jgi:putative transcriptional regulator